MSQTAYTDRRLLAQRCYRVQDYLYLFCRFSTSITNSKRQKRLPDEHFVDKDTERPPVDGFVVASTLDDFWRQVLGRATQRPRPAAQT